MTTILPTVKTHFEDNNGRPLVGGKVYFYIPNTSTPKNTWQDEAKTILNTNPVILDARGEALIWGEGSYRQVLRDADGNLIWDGLVTELSQRVDALEVDVADLTAFKDQLSGASGSSLIGFLQSGTGAVQRNVQDRLRDRVSTKDFGILGDGTDETAKLQAALNASVGRSLLIQGTITTGPLTIPSNSVILFDPNAQIVARTGFGLNDCLINITNASNVTIFGNGAKVRMLKAEYTTGEQRHGVIIRSSTDIRIYDLVSADAGGDCFYIGEVFGSGVLSARVWMNGCVGDNGRRQGLSITGVIGCWVNNCEFKNTNGTPPQAGIDVEPNQGGQVTDLFITNLRTSNNKGASILVAPLFQGNNANTIMNINIDNVISWGDGQAAGNEGALRFDNGAVPANKIGGLIRARNITVFNCGGPGLVVGNLCWQNSPNLEIDGMRITNPGGTGTPSTAFSSGVSMFSTFGVGTIDDISLKNVYCEDLRTPAKMYVPFYLSGPFALNRVKFENCDGVGGLLANQIFFIVGNTNDVVVNNQTPRTYTLPAGNFLAMPLAGTVITQSGSGVLTLPTIAAHIGYELEFYNSIGSTLQIRPDPSDIIQEYGLFTGNDLILRQAGARIRLKATTSGWAPIKVAGTNAPLGYFNPGKNLYQSAAPTTGNWLRGDRIINNIPAVGQPKSWVCTVAGTPGTWVSEGNL